MEPDLDNARKILKAKRRVSSALELGIINKRLFKELLDFSAHNSSLIVKENDPYKIVEYLECFRPPLIKKQPNFTKVISGSVVHQEIGSNGDVKVSERSPFYLCLTYDYARSQYSVDKRKSYAVQLASEYYKLELSKKSNNLLGLSEILWDQIFFYLDIEDLKTFRFTCREGNYLIENSLSWAVDLYFVHDEIRHPRTHSNPTIPFDQICEDNTLGWPDVQLRHFKSPFSGKKYFNETYINGNQLLKIKVYPKVKTLEIFNCCLTWFDFLEVVGCLPNLVEFAYTHTKEYFNQNNVLKVMKADLVDHLDIVSALKKAENKKYRNFKTNVSKTLRRVRIQALNLHLTNYVFGILNQLCHTLEVLEICFSEILFLHTPQQGNSRQLKLEFPKFDARKLIHNNQNTLKTIHISFIEEIFQRGRKLEHSPMIPTAPIIDGSFWPHHEKLSLKELIIEIPEMISIPEQFLKGNCPMPMKTLKEIETAQLNLFLFYRTQTSISHFVLGTLVDPMESKLKKQNLTTLLQGFSSVDFALSVLLHFKKNEVKEGLSEFPLIMDGPLNVIVRLDDTSLPYKEVFPSTMCVLKNALSLQIEVKTSVPVSSFEVQILISKFPSLTRLVIVDENLRGVYPTQKYEDSAKITDLNFQSIIYFLPSLTELVLQCNMAMVTDFGLTGITPEGCQRMQKENLYICQEGENLGKSISNLKHLEILELHGLGNEVTGVTVYCANFETMNALEELYLFSPKFTKRQKKDLKDKFSLRKNFQLLIM